MRKRFISLILGLVLLSSSAAATEYFVNPQGSDSASGSREAPWKTIQKAAETMGPGDLVFIAAGLYHESITTVRDGDAERGPISFAALGDGNPVIDGSGLEEETGFTIAHSYIKLKGLEIRKWRGTGIWISGAGFVSIERCEVHQVPYGIGAADGTHDFTLKNVRIHHFDLYGFDVSPSGGEDCFNGLIEDCVAHTGRDPEQNVDGFALGHGNQYGFRFIRCEAYEVFDGFDISAKDTILDKCSAHDCWNGGYKLWQDRIILNSCLAYDNKESNVELDWDESPGTVTLSNCTFVGSGAFNIWVENSGDSLHMYNCIITSGENIGLAFEQAGIRNYRGDFNVFHNNNAERAVVVAYEDEFRLDQVAGGEWTRASGQDSHSIVIENPESELFINRKMRDFRLRPGCPAIDSGTATKAPLDDFLGTGRPYGSGIDIGAFEWTPEKISRFSASAKVTPTRDESDGSYQ